MWTELGLCLWSEKFFCKFFQCSLQVSKGDILIYYQTFYLMERW